MHGMHEKRYPTQLIIRTLRLSGGGCGGRCGVGGGASLVLLLL